MLKKIKKSLVDNYWSWRARRKSHDEEQQRMHQLFGEGYDSGDIERGLDDPLMREEYDRSGGDYLQLFNELVLPQLDTAREALEIGGGKGSWARATFNNYPQGRLTVVDRLPVEKLLRARCPQAGDRLVFEQVTDNDYSRFPDACFDFAYSFGVFVHIPIRDIPIILQQLRPKMKPDSEVIIHYSNWEKLETWGWEKGEIPLWFRNNPDHPDCWWTRNNTTLMRGFAEAADFNIEDIDLDYFTRDSVCRLRT